ncbi:MAG: hypothetical protein WD035_00010 [Balneolaceae bacterium]
MRYLKYIVTSLLFVALVSCDAINDPDLPIPLDETMKNTGAFLRILSVETAAFDLAEIDDAAYEIEVEYFDGEGASLLERVDFYASYTSFGLTAADRREIDETDQPFFSVPASEFSEDPETGTPKATISVPLTDLLSTLGLSRDEVGVEDRFDIRWELHLTDGRNFTQGDANPAVEGGGFYSSPFFARVFTVQALGPDEFTGTYRFESQNAGVFGWWTFSEVFEAELSVDPDNSLNGRVFTAEPYAENWGGLAPIDVPLNLGRTATVNTGSAGIGTGLGCGDGLAVGQVQDQSNLVIIDVSDDSEFTMVLGDNVRSDCGTGPVDVVITATKQ